MLTFNIQLQRNGSLYCKFTVPAREAGLVGGWYQGKPYKPDPVEVRAMLPYQYRKAFDRALAWWQSDSMSGWAMPLKCDLVSLKGAPMGTLFATPNWETPIDAHWHKRAIEAKTLGD